MNSKQALDVLEALAAEGALRRISSDNRLTKGIRYETSSGQQLQLDLGNAVARQDAGRLTLNEAGQNRATIVLENDPQGTLLSPAEASIAGVEYRPGRPFNGSHYKDVGSRLTPERQALFYVDTAAGLRQLLSLYERHADKPIEKLKKRFLATFPDFEEAGAFAAKTGRYYDTYRSRVDALLTAVARHPTDGWAVMRDVLAASQGDRVALPPFFDGDVSWRVPRARDVDASGIDAALDLLVGGAKDPPAAIAAFTHTFQPLLEAIGQGTAFRDTRVVPATVLAAVAPDRAISVRYTPYSKAERLLNNRTLFRNKPITAEEYRAVLALAEQIRAAMIDWGWAPRDLWDVHGFILTALKDEDEMSDDAVLARFDVNPAFAIARQQWSADQRQAFVTVARAGHGAGLDWFFVKDGTELRCGRKDAGKQRASAVLGYFGATGPWFGFNTKRGIAYARAVGIRSGTDAPLNASLADRISDLFATQPDLQTGGMFEPAGRPGRWPAEAGAVEADEDDQPTADASNPMIPNPTNLILCGPPGTGKTYATARHAVRLCDGLSIDDPLLGPDARDALMARYRELAAARRIEFVTFHQSMAYEEFVEGLRPSSLDEEGRPLAAGFRLAPTDGIFRTIARRAETSTGPGAAGFTLGDRKVFKMSIGEATNPDDAHLFEEAIAGSYTLLGFGDIDWSDARFGDRQAIIEAVRAEEGDDAADATSGRVQMPNIFRNWMRIGDVVVVSKGNSLFRAIGEITGDYAYVPREGGGYGHRRAVRWLWVDRSGVPSSEIYGPAFMMKSAYVLTPADLNVPALERYANSQKDVGSGTPEPFVLVIDEINRANISKVFGELITLLEADKRIGKPNELRVRLPYSKHEFGVPANLHIVGTMNTADRSIALIDKALRRRFDFVEMMPRYDIDGMRAEIGGVTLADVLRAINERIEYLLDREHQIGHAWLLGCDTRAKLDAAMRDRIIPLIAEYFFEDWGRTADVLGGRDDNPFLDKQKLSVPRGFEDGEDRFRWLVRDTFAPDAYKRLIAG